MRTALTAALAICALTSCATSNPNTPTTIPSTPPLGTTAPTQELPPVSPNDAALLDVNATYVALLDHAARTGTEPVTISDIKDAFPKATIIAADKNSDDKADDLTVTVIDRTGEWCLIIPDQSTGRAAGTAPGKCPDPKETDK